jgi:hypothetical protein
MGTITGEALTPLVARLAPWGQEHVHAFAHGRLAVTENPVGRRSAGAVLDTGTLDYSWWASDGPTGGYLLRLALEFILDLKADVDEIRSITVQVLRRAAASSYTVEATALPGANGVRVLTVIFGQQGPFAIAHVVFARPRGEGFASDAMPPAVLPSAAYDVLKTSDGSGPPVLRQFDYRPTTGPDGSIARDGWDLTWVRRFQSPLDLLHSNVFASKPNVMRRQPGESTRGDRRGVASRSRPWRTAPPRRWFRFALEARTGTSRAVRCGTSSEFVQGLPDAARLRSLTTSASRPAAVFFASGLS